MFADTKRNAWSVKDVKGEEIMRETKIICDKCKKEISNDYNYKVDLGIDDVYVYDFCTDCYSSLIKTVGTWFKGREDGNR